MTVLFGGFGGGVVTVKQPTQQNSFFLSHFLKGIKTITVTS